MVDVTNFHLERGLSTFDTHHRFITSYTYDLPYGHGRQFGASSSGVLNAFLGGWQTNGILTIQTGNPLDPSTGLQLSGYANRYAARRLLQSQRVYTRPCGMV